MAAAPLPSPPPPPGGGPPSPKHVEITAKGTLRVTIKLNGKREVVKELVIKCGKNPIPNKDLLEKTKSLVEGLEAYAIKAEELGKQAGLTDRVFEALTTGKFHGSLTATAFKVSGIALPSSTPAAAAPQPQSTAEPWTHAFKPERIQEIHREITQIKKYTEFKDSIKEKIVEYSPQVVISSITRMFGQKTEQDEKDHDFGDLQRMVNDTSSEYDGLRAALLELQEEARKKLGKDDSGLGMWDKFRGNKEKCEKDIASIVRGMVHKHLQAEAPQKIDHAKQDESRLTDVLKRALSADQKTLFDKLYNSDGILHTGSELKNVLAQMSPTEREKLGDTMSTFTTDSFSTTERTKHSEIISTLAEVDIRENVKGILDISLPMDLKKKLNEMEPADRSKLTADITILKENLSRKQNPTSEDKSEIAKYKKILGVIHEVDSEKCVENVRTKTGTDLKSALIKMTVAERKQLQEAFEFLLGKNPKLIPQFSGVNRTLVEITKTEQALEAILDEDKTQHKALLEAKTPRERLDLQYLIKEMPVKDDKCQALGLALETIIQQKHDAILGKPENIALLEQIQKQGAIDVLALTTQLPVKDLFTIIHQKLQEKLNNDQTENLLKFCKHWVEENKNSPDLHNKAVTDCLQTIADAFSRSGGTIGTHALWIAGALPAAQKPLQPQPVTARDGTLGSFNELLGNLQIKDKNNRLYQASIVAIADDLATIQRDHLNAITPNDLFVCTSGSTRESVEKYKKLSDRLSQSISVKISSAETDDEIKDIIKFFIRVGAACYERGDFASASAIYSALNAASQEHKAVNEVFQQVKDLSLLHYDYKGHLEKLANLQKLPEVDREISKRLNDRNQKPVIPPITLLLDKVRATNSGPDVISEGKQQIYNLGKSASLRAVLSRWLKAQGTLSPTDQQLKTDCFHEIFTTEPDREIAIRRAEKLGSAINKSLEKIDQREIKKDYKNNEAYFYFSAWQDLQTLKAFVATQPLLQGDWNQRIQLLTERLTAIANSPTFMSLTPNQSKENGIKTQLLKASIPADPKTAEEIVCILSKLMIKAMYGPEEKRFEAYEEALEILNGLNVEKADPRPKANETKRAVAELMEKHPLFKIAGAPDSKETSIISIADKLLEQVVGAESEADMRKAYGKALEILNHFKINPIDSPEVTRIKRAINAQVAKHLLEVNEKFEKLFNTAKQLLTSHPLTTNDCKKALAIINLFKEDPIADSSGDPSIKIPDSVDPEKKVPEISGVLQIKRVINKKIQKELLGTANSIVDRTTALITAAEQENDPERKLQAYQDAYTFMNLFVLNKVEDSPELQALKKEIERLKEANPQLKNLQALEQSTTPDGVAWRTAKCLVRYNQAKTACENIKKIIRKKDEELSLYDLREAKFEWGLVTQANKDLTGIDEALSKDFAKVWRDLIEETGKLLFPVPDKKEAKPKPNLKERCFEQAKKSLPAPHTRSVTSSSADVRYRLERSEEDKDKPKQWEFIDYNLFTKISGYDKKGANLQSFESAAQYINTVLALPPITDDEARNLPEGQRPNETDIKTNYGIPAHSKIKNFNSLVLPAGAHDPLVRLQRTAQFISTHDKKVTEVEKKEEKHSASAKELMDCVQNSSKALEQLKSSFVAQKKLLTESYKGASFPQEILDFIKIFDDKIEATGKKLEKLRPIALQAFVSEYESLIADQLVVARFEKAVFPDKGVNEKSQQNARLLFDNLKEQLKGIQILPAIQSKIDNIKNNLIELGIIAVDAEFQRNMFEV